MFRAGVVAAALMLAACTTTSTVRLSADRSMITTRGNAFTSVEAVQRDLLLQAAQQAQAAGYEWFLIEDSRDASTSGVLMTPARGDASAAGNAYGWSGSASYTGASYMPYVKPGVQVLVLFGRGPLPRGAFSASEVLALNPKR